MTTLNKYSNAEELANTISHALGVVLSIIALTVLLITSIDEGNPLTIVSYAIYGTSLVLLFLASTLYHGSRNEKFKQTFKLLDHCAIYILIAGSYTPLMLIPLKGPLGYGMLTLIWLIAVAGIIFKVKFGHKHKKLSLMTYLGMGFISLAIINQLYLSLSTQALILLGAGGLIYTLGVIFYVQKRIPFNHAIWHLFVLAGAACHFFMMWLYL
ncbi:MAG: hemolysin III family protein [Colwellia sp.]|nr:hemolysin III family protein [Colwellia sp.]